MSEVRESCMTSSSTRHLIWRSGLTPSSSAVTSTGPTGDIASQALPWVHCEVWNCQSRTLMSLPTVKPAIAASACCSLALRTALPMTSTSRRRPLSPASPSARSEEHTSELQSPDHLVCRLLLEKKKKDAAKRSQRDKPLRPARHGPYPREPRPQPRACPYRVRRPHRPPVSAAHPSPAHLRRDHP